MKKTEISKILEWHNSGTLKTEEAVEQICSLFNVIEPKGKLVCDTCKSGLINYPEIGRRTCRCGALGYNVTD